MADEKKETAPVVAENVEAAAAAETAKAPAADVKRKKGGRYVPSGIAFILATFNNTKVTFTDLHGNVLCWSTSGKNGFKGSRKSTAYAAQVVAADAAKKAEALGMKDQRTGRRKRICCQRHCFHRYGNQCDQGHHSCSAQRMQTSEKTPCLM